MSDLDLMTDDQALDVAMQEEAALIEAARANGPQRNYAVVYLDAKGNLKRFPFLGKPTELVEKLMEEGVDPTRNSKGRLITPWGRSWEEPGEGRLSEAFDQEIFDHLKTYVAELEAAQKAKAVASATAK